MRDKYIREALLFIYSWGMWCTGLDRFCATRRVLAITNLFPRSQTLLSTQSSPLDVAEACLRYFHPSGGDVKFLEEARSNAMIAFAQGHSLDVRLSAAVIEVSAGYVYYVMVS